jgi:hypothetical protein
VSSRIFSTGELIYGAARPRTHQDIVDDAEAYSALLRLRVGGGMGSISYKNYNLPVRLVVRNVAAFLNADPRNTEHLDRGC